MKRFAIFVYGIVCYAVFFATFLYAIAFIGDLPDIPRSIDGEPLLPSGQALAIDLLLLTLFAVQHSVMARPAFKAVWTRIIPTAAEHLCAVLQPGADRAVPFLATAGRSGLVAGEHRRPGTDVWRLRLRLGAGAVQHLPDQPFRPVRPAPGVAGAARQALHAAGVQGSGGLSAGASSVVRGLVLRLLVHPEHERHPHAVRPGEHRLYPGRHQLRGARPAAGAPRVRRLPAPGAHAAAASARAGAAGNG